MPSTDHLALRMSTHNTIQRLMRRTVQADRAAGLRQPYLHPDRSQTCYHLPELVDPTLTLPWEVEAAVTAFDACPDLANIAESAASLN